jgi:NADH-quinone oxidoreductase subunit G
VLENDLYLRENSSLVARAIAGSEFMVGLDLLPNKTMDGVDVIFPAAATVESTGTFVNYESRAQRFYQVYEPKDGIAPSWYWLSRLGQTLGREDMNWANAQEVSAGTGFTELDKVGLEVAYRGVAGLKIPRGTHRLSGRTAITANDNVHEPKTSVDDRPPFSHSMEGLNGGQPGEAVPFVWAPGWNSNQAVAKFQSEVGGDMAGMYAPVFLSGKYSLCDTGAPDRSGGFVKTHHLQVFPLQDVFISDELAIRSKALRERGSDPYLVLHPKDAERMGVVNGDGVLLGEASYLVKTDPLMPAGAMGMIAGLRGDQVESLTLDPDYSPRVEVIARS